MLTLQEMKQRQYEAQTRKGYNREMMDSLLNDIYASFQEMQLNNEKMQQNVKTLSSGIQYYKSIEQTLQKALILAEQTAKETKDAATLRAEAIEKEAQKKADNILQTAKEETENINLKCADMVKQYNQFKLQYKQVATAQLEMLNSESFEIFAPDMNAIYQKSELKAIEEQKAEAAVTAEQVITPSLEVEKMVEEPAKDVAPEVTFTQQAQFSEEEINKRRKDFHERALKLKEAEQVEEVKPKDNPDYEPLPMDVLHPMNEKQSDIQVKPEPQPVPVRPETEMKPEEQSLDYLLRDLDMSASKSKKDDDDDPFEFLGSLDDY